MGRCPFGYVADDEQEGDQLEEKSCCTIEEITAGEEDVAVASKKVDGTKQNTKGDPLGWFYENQIKSEADFQAKKELLRQEARKKLDEIMDKKSQRLMWPSDSEFDDLSISSGELSELDSDVHSLASLQSCADSWIQSKSYTNPAERASKWAAGAALVLSVWAMVMSYKSLSVVQSMMGMLEHSNWPAFSFLAALALSSSATVTLLASQWRSKRLLLASQVMHVLAYAAAALLVVLMYQLPTQVDSMMKDNACNRWGDKSGKVSAMCERIPGMQARIREVAGALFWSVLAEGVMALVMLGLGSWYTLELCFVEKKAAKHVRRHKRNKHTIPWEKIKIVGPVTQCGGAPPKKATAAGGAGGSKCPIMSHGGGAKDKQV